MKVDLKLTSQKTFNKGDLLICNGDNIFVPISQEELLKDLQKEVNELKDEVKVMKQFLKVYQGETTKLLKGVLFNG
jgi:hypothetical protein